MKDYIDIPNRKGVCLGDNGPPPINKQKFTLGFIFDSELERVLLLKKNIKNTERTKELVSLLDGKLNGVGGVMEFDETPHQCMSRECYEETNLLIKENGWFNFCNLDAKFGYVYCFYTIVDNFIKYNDDNKPELIYKQMEDEFPDIYFVEDGYRHFSHMNNLDWLIPMALNHAQNLDSCELFEIKEVYGKE